MAEPYDPVAQVLRQCLRQAADLAEACGPLAPYLAPLLPELGIAAQDAGEATLDRGAAARVRRDGRARAGRRPARRPPLGGRGHAAAAARASPPGCARCRCCWSRSPATRCPPTRTVSAACARSCAGSATRSSCRCGRSTRDDTARLAAAVAGEELDDDVVAALHERAHGIPFYVEELAATLALEGRGARSGLALPLPETRARRRAAAHGGALARGAQRARDRAAVCGAALRRLRTCRACAAGDALAEALAAGFLVEDGPGRLAFRHALVRDAVYQAIPWTRRRRCMPPSRARSRTRARRPPSAPPHWLGAGDIERARDGAGRGRGGIGGRLRLPRRGEPLRAGARSRTAARTRALRAARASRGLRGAGGRPRRLGARLARGRSTAGAAAARSSSVAEAQHAIGPRARAARQHRAGAHRLVRGRRLVRGVRPRARTRPARGSRPPRSCCRSCGNLRPALAAIEAATRRAPGPTSPPELRSRARRSRAWCSASSARRRARCVACTRRWRRRSPPATPRRPPRPIRRSPSCTRTAGDLGQASEAYEVAIDYCASNRRPAHRRPSARPASATCCASAASGGAASRSAGSLLDDPSLDAGDPRDRLRP